MLNEDKMQILNELGLTTLQAEVYLTLAMLGKTTARKVAHFSKIARQEVYRIIGELSEVGLVSKILTTPTTFKPLPLNEGISLLLERKIDKTNELQIKVEELLKKKNSNIRKKNLLIDYTFEMLPSNAPWFRDNATRFATYKTFALLTSFKRFSSRVNYDKKAFIKGAEKGTKIRILTEKPPDDSPVLPIINSLRNYQDLKIKFISSVNDVVLIIMDHKRVALALQPSNRVGPPYLVSNHPSFVRMAENYFEKRWEEATEDPI